MAEMLHYNTQEFTFGRWTDGKMVYRKTVDLGSMPAADASKSVAHGISNIDKIVKMEGVMRNSAGRTLFLPHVNRNTPAHSCTIEADKTNVTTTSGYNRSSWTGEMTLYYTKTTD